MVLKSEDAVGELRSDSVRLGVVGLRASLLGSELIKQLLKRPRIVSLGFPETERVALLGFCLALKSGG